MLSLRTRRVVYIIFILLFLATAPILVLYTAGYRYNFKKGEVQKTGSISIKAFPYDSEIYFENVNQTGYRPDNTVRIVNLKPGEHEIKINKDGYYPWQKKVEIYSGTNTFVDKVILFKQNLPEQVINNKISLSQLAPDQGKIAYVATGQTSDQIYIFNYQNLQTTLVNQTNLKINAVDWSENSAQLLLTTESDDYLIYDLTKSKEPSDITTITNVSMDKVFWDKTNNYTLYGLSGRAIYQINTLTKEYRIIHYFPSDTEDTNISDFIAENKNLFYIQTTADGSYLNKIDLDQPKKPAARILKLARADNYQFYYNKNLTITILDTTKQKMYLIAPHFESIILEAEAKNFNWDSKDKKLVYYNDFELYIYDLDTKNNKLITRFGQIIKRAYLIPKIEYIAFLVDNSLQIAELDERGKRNIIDLTKNEKVDDFYLDQSGENIYFPGQIGQSSGLYKINIQ
ncbi:MAG: PEGA domain-containing protein [Patescibacteria group bacterium]